MKKNIGLQSGFTLIEMMIVVSIIGIMSAMTIVNFRSNEKEREMDNQALLLLDGIKRMQTSSLSGGLVNGQVPMSYRIVVDKCLSSCSYDLIASTTSSLISIGDSIGLPASAVDIVDELEVSIGDNLLIEIFPPRGKMVLYIDGIVSPTNEAIIKLEHIGDSGVVKKVRTNGISGRLDLIR
jgi:prepilin-type N-terminal cleavage/methylation domain-containing protein